MSDPRFDDLVELSGPLARQFAEAGQTLHLVGGVVRDAVLGRPVRGDIDLTTDADPDRIKAIISGHVEAMWTQGERFGTIGCRVDGRTFEITTHRVDRYEPGSRKPTVRFTNALEADLARRDFTVNAMAVTLPQGELVDPFAGQADLAAGVLRTPLSPEESFSDDPLRMLRAARFTASLDLVPRPELVAAMTAMSDRLDIVSVERRRDELDRLLLLPDPGPGLSLLVSTGLGARVVPELGDPSAPLDAVRRAPARLVPRLATLLAGSGEAGAVARLRALRSANEQVDAVRRVVAAVATLNAASDGGEHGPALDGAVRRFVSAGGRHVADAVATLTALRPELGRDVAVALDRLAAGGDLDDLGPQLDGDAVQRVLGIAPGPEVGEALAFLQRLRWDEGTLPGDAVRERLRRWWTARAAPA